MNRFTWILSLTAVAVSVGCEKPDVDAISGTEISQVIADVGDKAAGGSLVAGETVRFASFNCSMNRNAAGKLAEDLKAGDEQARKIALIVQKVRPDVLLLNEFDYDEKGEALKLFRDKYLAANFDGYAPIEYQYYFVAPVNTGVASGVDVNRDGKIALPDDGFGFGRHPGQYGMVVLSRYEIDLERVRTFQKFLWQDMPDAMLPKGETEESSFYDEATLEVLRLSSKSHWDVTVRIGEDTIHFLVCHPTPPAFDGPEDRNGCRNHDEIRFWADYISSNAEWIVDDEGKSGGLDPKARFVIAGDLNADPNDGDSVNSAAHLLTNNPLIQDPLPASHGAVEQAKLQGGANENHKGSHEHDTADFNDKSVGNLRVDYVLPSANQTVLASGVFWPKTDQPDYSLVGSTDPKIPGPSDHHLVWVDIQKEHP